MLTAERNVKFRSSQTVLGQFIAESATQNEDHRADIKRLSLYLYFVPKFSFIFIFYRLFLQIVWGFCCVL